MVVGTARQTVVVMAKLTVGVMAWVMVEAVAKPTEVDEVGAMVEAERAVVATVQGAATATAAATAVAATVPATEVEVWGSATVTVEEEMAAVHMAWVTRAAIMVAAVATEKVVVAKAALEKEEVVKVTAASAWERAEAAMVRAAMAMAMAAVAMAVARAREEAMAAASLADEGAAAVRVAEAVTPEAARRSPSLQW